MYFHAKFQVHSSKNGHLKMLVLVRTLVTLGTTESSSKSKSIWPIILIPTCPAFNNMTLKFYISAVVELCGIGYLFH